MTNNDPILSNHITLHNQFGQYYVENVLTLTYMDDTRHSTIERDLEKERKREITSLRKILTTGIMAQLFSNCVRWY